MISLLNRREVTVTHDTNRLNQLREKLASNTSSATNATEPSPPDGAMVYPTWMRTTPMSMAFTSTATTTKRRRLCSFN